MLQNNLKPTNASKYDLKLTKVVFMLQNNFNSFETLNAGKYDFRKFWSEMFANMILASTKVVSGSFDEFSSVQFSSVSPK